MKIQYFGYLVMICVLRCSSECSNRITNENIAVNNNSLENESLKETITNENIAVSNNSFEDESLNETLDRNIKYVTTITFYGISEIPDVRELDLSKHNIMSIDSIKILQIMTYYSSGRNKLTNLNNIEYMPNLERVRIEFNEAELTDMSALGNLKNLETLYLANFSGGTFNFDEISSLNSLNFVIIHGLNVDLKGVEKLPVLTYLNIGNCFNTEYISKINNLEDLSLEIFDDEPDINFIENMTSLKFLLITSNSFPYKSPHQRLDVTPIRTLVNLERLDLDGFILDNLSALNGLNAAVYGDNNLIGNDIGRPTNLPSSKRDR